jgi:putative transposase
MPRNARCFQKALCYHVMNRRLNREAMFVDERDFEEFKQLVKEYRDLCGAKVYHWAWMGNHYHMVAEVVFENLRPMMGGIQQVYARYHHLRHGSSGVFWQGRFKSKPVEIGGYLVSCGRYIERNPVRAGMTARAWEYRWSSAAHYVNGAEDGLTDTNRYLGLMGPQERRMYGEALMSGVDDALMQKLRRARVIGDAGFAANLHVEKGRHRRKRGHPAETVRISIETTNAQ